MEKNKTGKYLKYAIGEIVLVVIGILIALQINNWNQKRIQLEQGQTLMFELMNEINDYVATCNWAENGLRLDLKNQEEVFLKKNLSSLSLDSLLMFINGANVDIKVTQNTFERMKNQGITHLSKNDSLNKMIVTYFSKKVPQFNRRIEYDWNRLTKRNEYFFNNLNIGVGNDLVLGFKEISDEEIKRKIINFINLPRTQQEIMNCYYDAKSSLETVLYFKTHSIEVINAIHKELLKTNPDLDLLTDITLEQSFLKN